MWAARAGRNVILWSLDMQNHLRLPGRRAITLRAIIVGLAVVAQSLVGTTGLASAQSADTIVRWNRAMLSALSTPGALPPNGFLTRPLAIVSVAVFEAVNSFDRQYHPYAAYVAVTPGASRDAAAAQAAHDVLVELMPSQRAAFDALLADTLAAIPPQAAQDGAAIGATAARLVLDLRARDGWERPVKPLELPSLPGYWTPTPPAHAPAALTHYPDVAGFIVANGHQFMTEGPPALTSDRYARDLDETKTLGAAGSTVRTPAQTQAARLWAGVGTSTNFGAVWNLVLGDVARARGLSGVETARAFALMNMAHHDALLTSFTGKFLYGFWRPVTAIRQAHLDGNPATDADATWTPLVNTPPYPGHPGNMACLGAAQARVLERIFGRDDVPFSVTWKGTTGPDVTRAYNGFRELADEGGYSRIWAGIHFRFETLASFGSCTRLGDYAVDNVLRSI
jgi:hypothetical protein